MNEAKIEEKIKLPQIDPEVASKEIGDFLVKYLNSYNLKGGVVGLSGGIDSTTVAYLAKRAFEGKELKLFGLIMPSKANASADEEDGIFVAKQLGIEYEVIALEPIIETFCKTLSCEINEYDRGNLSSEVRAIVLSRYAASKNSLVLGTGNRDEDYGLGYFTKRGDGQVDISPIGDLSKRHVRQVASYLGAPDKLVNRIPTAGLWSGQTDEKELGFNYLEAEIVIAVKDQGYSREEIKTITEFGKVRKEDEDIDIVDKVLNMHEGNQYKMKMPPIAKVTKR